MTAKKAKAHRIQSLTRVLGRRRVFSVLKTLGMVELIRVSRLIEVKSRYDLNWAIAHHSRFEIPQQPQKRAFLVPVRGILFSVLQVVGSDDYNPGYTPDRVR